MGAHNNYTISPHAYINNNTNNNNYVFFVLVQEKTRTTRLKRTTAATAAKKLTIKYIKKDEDAVGLVIVKYSNASHSTVNLFLFFTVLIETVRIINSFQESSDLLIC